KNMKGRGDDLRRQIAKGDQKAFAEFYYGYQDRVAKHAFRIVKDREQTKEIVQDVFVRLWQKHHVFVDISDLEAYIFMVTKNSCLTAIRTRIREKGKREAWKEEHPEVHNVPHEHMNTMYALLDRAIVVLHPLPR